MTRTEALERARAALEVAGTAYSQGRRDGAEAERNRIVALLNRSVELVARTIFDADNDIDGDQVGDMIYEDSRIEGPTKEETLEQTMRVCRSAARAACSALAEIIKGGENG